MKVKLSVNFFYKKVVMRFSNSNKTIAEIIQYENKKAFTEKDDSNNIKYQAIKNYQAIISGLGALLCFRLEYSLFGILLGLYSAKKYISKNSITLKAISIVDKTITANLGDEQINHSLDKIVEFIYKHPELGLHYNKENSHVYCTNYSLYRNLSIGHHYKNDLTLHDKRFEIRTHLKKNDDDMIYINSYVTFITPTNFKIEYLRVIWMGVNPEKTFTIIDGRKNMKDTVEDYVKLDTIKEDTDKINKRIFTKYREPDKINYDI